MTAPDRKKLDEVHFLADEFGIPAPQAAGLLTEDTAEADDLAAQALREERERDPLAEVPVPGHDRDRPHLEREVADLEKPVRRGDSPAS